MKYKKSALTVDNQIELLRLRGMEFADEQAAKCFLKRVSYYRLSAYFVRYKKADGRYKQGTQFEGVIDVYNFDRVLRLLLLDAIERIEVVVRCATTYHLALKYGPFGYADPKNFSPTFSNAHENFLKELAIEERRSHETFVRHFRQKYSAERDLPIWMASELLSFGAISRLFPALHPDAKREMGKLLGAKDLILGSWLHVLSYTRNVCAHHCRLWNRSLGVSPKLPSRDKGWPYDIPRADRVYAVLIICAHLMEQIATDSSWCPRLVELVRKNPQVPLADMGFPKDWLSKSPWCDVA